MAWDAKSMDKECARKRDFEAAEDLSKRLRVDLDRVKERLLATESNLDRLIVACLCTAEGRLAIMRLASKEGVSGVLAGKWAEEAGTELHGVLGPKVGCYRLVRLTRRCRVWSEETALMAREVRTALPEEYVPLLPRFAFGSVFALENGHRIMVTSLARRELNFKIFTAPPLEEKEEGVS